MRENLWRGVHFLSWMKHARKASERVFFWRFSSENLLEIVFSSWKIVTTIKVYGKIRSNSFSGNYTPCARRAKQVFTYCACLLHGCHEDYYIVLKRNCTQIRWSLLKYKRTRSRLKGNKLNWSDEPHLRLTLNAIMSVFWSSRKLFYAFLLRSVALVVHLQVFLIKHFASILSVLLSWVNYVILWYLCGFREGYVDYFLYKLINLAKFAIFSDGTFASRRKIFKLRGSCRTRFPYKVKRRYNGC